MIPPPVCNVCVATGPRKADQTGGGMTYRQLRRQNLLRAIELWMRHHGAYFVFALCFSLATAHAATDETKKPAAKPSSLMKILSDNDLLTTTAPSGEKIEAKKAVPAENTKKNDKDADIKKNEEKTDEKTVAGTVSFIRKNKMAVEFKESEEIFLTIDPGVKLKRVKNFSEIGRGDKVSVKYTETFRDPKESGGERFVVSMVVKEIVLSGKAKKASDLISEPKGL